MALVQLWNRHYELHVLGPAYPNRHLAGQIRGDHPLGVILSPYRNRVGLWGFLHDKRLDKINPVGLDLKMEPKGKQDVTMEANK